ncbi:Crp/Fnr family transcriptional regulator [Mucilaginibacter sp. 10I4]|uniref:Crp/Fnr family transcriptional regulator n=1 Tax=Mucilaginibacter sp. 10I4 TaxID=3048580 RepID=UPI002B227B1A|nr:Crp/Fnr family transcriptional regulator [Mucilaginibacter sp. 10I4]MEB0249708.1 Crp/Fnr family transcriptional regulator [Mucilaginibacter sp. 5B2]MEB0263050.1 Crp/Fnr family transcriptional regulator [Mucilaginibacter sp. 10I4]
MYPQLLAHIKRHVQLTPQEEQVLCDVMELKKYKKKEIILEPGQHCKGECFVLSGLLRQYYVNAKLNEQIVHFALENWWIADHNSILNHVPAGTYIQTIEASEILLLNNRDKGPLLEQIPKLDTYFRLTMQRAFMASQRRIGFLFNQTDEQRYRYFISLFPDFVQRVPQYMLASYLGFTPQFLSRIRAKREK